MQITRTEAPSVACAWARDRTVRSMPPWAGWKNFPRWTIRSDDPCGPPADAPGREPPTTSGGCIGDVRVGLNIIMLNCLSMMTGGGWYAPLEAPGWLGPSRTTWTGGRYTEVSG